jgi:phospholipid/cholesterol/gamma-HCH transport system ATP-binding protein
VDYVIRVENLKKSFGSRIVLDGISLNVKRRESYVVIGGSGSGKSVLVKCILGLVKPKSGTVEINGQNMMHLPQRAIFQTLLKCGVLFQGGALFDSLNVIENISFGLIYGYGKSIKEAYRIAMEKLELVDLGVEIAKAYPAELSGGMKKRVALARAIATDPDVIFFDEPTTGLDPVTSGTINELIVKCTKEIGISALSITHDIKSLKRISDRIGFLYKGKIIWEGTNSELTTTDNPYIRQFVDGTPNGPFSH